MVSKCNSCGRHLGYIIDGDVLCKCGVYNIIRPLKDTKIVVKSLYNPKSMASAHDSQ
ncbi:hypothetical protein Phi19:1_gp084 [Cellulophaga phage phi19:1]|uniref:Uncharacterized protein n=1 Tax=Cellulophaga phage phi19:1 TaxID=1327970 RepID=R9ZW04_9CAUD|nr:hypothetical protein Phi19:1_gp084 [Cellulophaga phage phi19:1]AGO47374.1 hypothetical protein Phi19:1_gp084 [Cellulophaga phage phi19:1]